MQADDEAVGDRQAATVGLVAAVGNDHCCRSHDRSLGDGVERRDEQDHLGEDEEDACDQQKVLPGVSSSTVLGDLVLSELGGQSRSVRRISEYLSRDNRESRLVDLTNMVPGHRSRAGDEPGGLRASRHRETVNVERTITDDRPIRAGNDLVDDDASCERLSGAILGDGQRQGERIAHLGFERPRDVVRNDGVVRGERTALSTRIHAWRIQRGCLGAGVNRVARSVLRREVKLVEGVDGDQLVPRRHPAGEGALGNRHFLVRGRLR